jgi:hypothetical protein
MAMARWLFDAGELHVNSVLCATEPVVGKHLLASKDASNTAGQVW